MGIKSLSDFRRNELSQYGEDGIIKEIFSRIGIHSRLCFEAGAWDGFHFSNTAKLWNEQEWSAILVESDPERADSCMANSVDHDLVSVYCMLVSRENGVDAILAKYLCEVFGEEEDVRSKFWIDLLSLDVDGNEWHILKGMTTRPRVICVEYNPTMPPHIEIVGGCDKNIGSSLQAFVRLLSPDYILVYATEVNAFFVQSFYFHKFMEFDPVEVVRYDMLDYMISDYAGKRMKYWANVYGREDELLPSFFKRIER